MHEFGLMSAMLETVEEQARQLGARKVLAINLVLGERAGVEESLRFYFEMLTPGTVAEGADIHIRRTPMIFHCAPCDTDYVPAEANFDCPACSKVGQLKSDGSEMFIESMEIHS